MPAERGSVEEPTKLAGFTLALLYYTQKFFILGQILSEPERFAEFSL